MKNEISFKQNNNIENKINHIAVISWQHTLHVMVKKSNEKLKHLELSYTVVVESIGKVLSILESILYFCKVSWKTQWSLCHHH